MEPVKSTKSKKYELIKNEHSFRKCRKESPFIEIFYENYILWLIVFLARSDVQMKYTARFSKTIILAF